MIESQECKTIQALPNEILLTIFSYLQTHDVKYNISNVCVQWSILARDKNLWKQLHFKTTNKSTKTFGTTSWYSTLKFLENTPELQNIIVSQGHCEEEVAEILKSLEDHCRSLRHIEFDVDVTGTLKYLKGLKNLTETVESLNIRLGSYQSQTSLFKILSRFKNLKKLVFSGADPQPSSFRSFLDNSPFLEALNMADIELSKFNFMSLCKAKSKFKRLSLKSDKLNEECLELLLTFPNLKRLMLTDGNSTAGKLSKVGHVKCLAVLHLQEDASSPVLTSTSLVEFFQHGFFQNLKELKLHKSRLDDFGAAAIRQNCPNLIYLEVMTYPRCRSSLSQRALIHFLHCERLQRFEILFDNSEEADWIYRRIKYIPHKCNIDEPCSIGLDVLLDYWDEIQIPVD